MSDIAKFFLESVRNDRLERQWETAELRTPPTEGMLAIREEWAQRRDLSRGEWIFLGQHVQAGCEGLTANPERPSAESSAQVLKAFLAVRSIELYRYYLGNLGTAEPAKLAHRHFDPSVVPGAVNALIHQLRGRSPILPASFYIGWRPAAIGYASGAPMRRAGEASTR